MDIPGPDIVGLNAHFRCPIGCGWAHTEPTDPGPSRMILDPNDIDGSINLHAETRGLLLRDRVERALRSHLQDQHPQAAPEWET
jgi:hypothetical protein